MDEVPEIFRDHFEECLTHFTRSFNSKIPKGSKGRTEAMLPMIDFCGVGYFAVRSWFGDEGERPRGTPLIKLMCYLDAHGYRIIEMERMSKILRNFSELIGFSVMSAKQASDEIGFKNTSSLYEVIWERAGIGDDKESRMWNLWKSKRLDLENKKRQLLKSGRLNFLLQKPSDHAILSIGAPEVARLSNNPLKRREATVSIMKALLLLIEDGALQDLATDSSILGLLTQLTSRLSSVSSDLVRGVVSERGQPSGL